MLEEMKLKDISKLVNLLTLKNDESKAESDGEIRIVILQRGWVVVGKYYQNCHDCHIENGYVIRAWGTERGLGQLAIEGKQENTKLDKIPLTKFHELTIVASMICNQSKWAELCK